MRKTSLLSGIALVLASAGALSAQQNPVATLRFGYRGAWVEGDEARHERYSDLRSGPVAGGSFLSENAKSAFELQAANVGYLDQQYAAGFNKFGKLKFDASWNSIPLNYAYNTLTPWVDQGNNVWKLDAATRTNVQNKVAGVLGIGTSGAQLNTPSVYRNLAKPFEMQSRRDIIDLGLQYRFTDALAVDVGFNTAKRGGNQPYGMSFAFNNANELPMEIDDRTTDMRAALEWAKNGTMLRTEWLNSNYKNEFQSITWDSPLRATDYATSTGSFDPSGYSNGNGPATGRLALAPSNSMNTFSVQGLHRFTAKTTMNGAVSYTSMQQDEELLPWTTNSVINQASVWATFPHLQHLPRETAEGEIAVTSAMLNMVTKPVKDLSFDAKLRYNKRDNKTPGFDAVEYVRFDAVPEETGGISVAHDVTRTTFEVGSNLMTRANASFRVAYVMDDVQRTGRVFGGLRDNTVRLSFDTYGSQLFKVRGMVESTARKGRDFSLEALEEGGSQEGARFYDEAPLDRTAGSLSLTLTPNSVMDFGVIVGANQDVYNDEGQEFGLLNSSNTSVNVTANFYPTSGITVGANFGWDKFKAVQESRTANPLSSPPAAYESWTDVMRNWGIDNDEVTKSFGVFMDMPNALKNTDIRVAYDQTMGDNAFNFFGPRINAMLLNYAPTTGDAKACGATATYPCFIPFEPVEQVWRNLRFDLTHMFNQKYGFSAGYSFDKFEVEDFATTNLADGAPRIDPLGSITTGYGNRPYSGNTVTLQLIYKLSSGKPAL